MKNTKTIPQMEQFFKEIKYLDKQGKFTIEFFTGIAPLYASHLFAGLEGGYCGIDSIDVLCEMFTVLLDNGFMDSACCLLEYLHNEVFDKMSPFLQAMLDDEEYAPMLLRTLVNALSEISDDSEYYCCECDE